VNKNWIDYFFFFFTHVASSAYSSSFFLSPFGELSFFFPHDARRTLHSSSTVQYVCAVCHYIRIDPLFPNWEEEKKEKAEKMLLFYGRAVVKNKKRRPSPPLPTHTITDVCVCVREWTWIPLLPIGSLIVYRHQLQQERKKIDWRLDGWWYDGGIAI